MSARQFSVLIVGVGLLAATGCGGPATGTVSGTVNFDGRPVTGGAIAFIPADGKPYQSEIQSDGTYRVDRVPLGEAIVTITPPPPADEAVVQKRLKETAGRTPPPPPTPFPARYTDMAKTDLRCTVQAGDNKYDPPLKR